MKAAVLTAPGCVEVIDVPDPEPGPRDVVVRVEVAGICGSDLTSFETGAYVAPGQVLGHEFAGIVSRVGDEVPGILPGTRVTALPLGRCGSCPACTSGRPNLCRDNVKHAIGYGLPGSFAELVRVPDALLGQNVFELARSNSSVGSMIEPLAVALRAVMQVGPKQGDLAAVLGLGMIGQCVARVLAHVGNEVVGVDLSPFRCGVAQAGVPEGAFASSLATALGHDPEGRARRPQVAVDASGAVALIEEAVRLLTGSGRLGVVSLPARPLDLDLRRLALLELELRGSYAYDTEFATAHSWVEDGLIDLSPLATSQFSLEDAAEAFGSARDADRQIKVQLLPGT